MYVQNGYVIPECMITTRNSASYINDGVILHVFWHRIAEEPTNVLTCVIFAEGSLFPRSVADSVLRMELQANAGFHRLQLPCVRPYAMGCDTSSLLTGRGPKSNRCKYVHTFQNCCVCVCCYCRRGSMRSLMQHFESFPRDG